MRSRQDEGATVVLISRRLRSTALVVPLFAMGLRVAEAAGSWTSIGPAGAVVNVLAVSPINPSIAYAGTSGAGLLATEDGGNTWRVATAALTYAGGSALDTISAVAIDPATPTTLYAGVTGYLFKSLDGGSSWTRLTWPGTAGLLQVLLVDPTAPMTLYAGTDSGIVLSTDAGASWSRVAYPLPGPPFGGVKAITVNASHVVYAGGGQNFGLARSVDGGRTWSRDVSQLFFRALVSDSRDPQVLYAGSYGAGVLKTTDGGTSWSQINAGLTDLLVRALAIDPQSGALYAGTDGSGVFKSVDAGSHWSPASEGLSHPLMMALAVAPGAPGILYAGAEGAGLFRSTDGAGSWRESNGGFAGTQVQKLAAHPSLSLLYAGIYGVDLLKTNRGAEWSAGASPVPSPDFQDIALSPSDPQTVWVATLGGLFKSTDAGSSWATKTPLDYVNIQSVAVDPANSSRVYCSTYRSPDRSFFRSDDGGNSWTAANTGLQFRSQVATVQAIVVDHDTPSTLYGLGLGNCSVYKSTDGAASWTSSPGLPDCATAIAMDPQSARTLYVATFSGVAKTTDGGGTWVQSQASSTARQAAALLVDRQNSNVVYAAVKYVGVFRSDDAGQTWTANNIGLASLSAVSLAQDARSGTLYAGTIGRGTFALTAGKSTRVVAPRH
jgi:photosystem II stability/assembly factor-like uncharacterized protein